MNRDDRDAHARGALLQATAEEWARLEGQALGRVLDEDSPTHPWPVDLDESPTDPVPPRDLPCRALQALDEALGLGPYDAARATRLFEPLETMLIPSEILERLRRKSAPP
jgi:hypothetical protein